MNYKVVISGAWKRFESDIVGWAKTGSLEMVVERRNGLVTCTTKSRAAIIRLLEHLNHSGARATAPFDSAIFPPLRAGSRPTIVRGTAVQREHEALEQLPEMAATPRGMRRKVTAV